MVRWRAGAETRGRRFFDYKETMVGSIIESVSIQAEALEESVQLVPRPRSDLRDYWNAFPNHATAIDSGRKFRQGHQELHSGSSAVIARKRYGLARWVANSWRQPNQARGIVRGVATGFLQDR